MLAEVVDRDVSASSSDMNTLLSSPPSQLTVLSEDLKPQPLRLQTAFVRREQLAPESLHFKKTVEVLKESYHETMMNLAEVELNIELAYLKGDMERVREKQQRKK